MLDSGELAEMSSLTEFPALTVFEIIKDLGALANMTDVYTAYEALDVIANIGDNS